MHLFTRSTLWKTFSLLWILGLASLIVFLSAHRGPDLSDEGIYLYDAWAAYLAPSGTPQSFTPQILEGYILGLPLFFLPKITLFGIRTFSFILWLSGYTLFYWGFARRLQQEWLLPFIAGFFFYSIYLSTLSYQTLPFVLIAGAGGLLMVASEKEFSWLSQLSALICPMFTCATVLSFFPSIATASITLFSSFSAFPKEDGELSFSVGRY